MELLTTVKKEVALIFRGWLAGVLQIRRRNSATNIVLPATRYFGRGARPARKEEGAAEHARVVPGTPTRHQSLVGVTDFSMERTTRKIPKRRARVPSCVYGIAKPGMCVGTFYRERGATLQHSAISCRLLSVTST